MPESPGTQGGGVNRTSGVPESAGIRGAVVTRNSGVPELRGTPRYLFHPEHQMPHKSEMRCPGFTMISVVSESSYAPGCLCHPDLRGAEVNRNSGVLELLRNLVHRSHSEVQGAGVTLNPGPRSHPEFLIQVYRNSASSVTR